MFLLKSKRILKDRALTDHPDPGPANGGMLYQMSYFRVIKNLCFYSKSKSILKDRALTGHPDPGPDNGGMLYQISYLRMDTWTLFRIISLSKQRSDFQRTKGLQK